MVSLVTHDNDEMDELFMKLITAHSARNTKCSYATAYNFFKRGLAKLGEVRQLETILHAELIILFHTEGCLMKTIGKYNYSKIKWDPVQFEKN